MIRILLSFFFRKHVSGGRLRKKALEIYQVLKDKHGYGPFVCSDGWLDKFKRRNGISVRRITGTAQKIPAIAPTLAAVFYNDISKVITSQGEVQRHCLHVGLYKIYYIEVLCCYCATGII